MNKTKRLIELIMVINNKKQFTVQELADEFGVSYRTIMRDLQELSELGVPLYSEVGLYGGYRILKERVLPPIAFTEREATTIFFINESLRYFGGLPFNVEWESILRKFHHYLQDDVKNKIAQLQNRIVFWNPIRDQSSEILQLILEASLDQNVVTITYNSGNGSSNRNVQFIGLYAYNGFWYCPAYCLQKNAFRLFRADRILSVVPANIESRDLSFVTLFDWLKEDNFTQTDHILKLKVFLTAKGVRRFSSDLTWGTKIQVHEDGTGWIITNIHADQIDYCSDLLFALGAEVKVFEPKEVVNKIKERLIETLHLYR